MNSSKIQKKQLNTMDNVESLTDMELREALKKHDISPGPITDSTRSIYRKKLASLLESSDFNENTNDVSITATIGSDKSTSTHSQESINLSKFSVRSSKYTNHSAVAGKNTRQTNHVDDDDDDDEETSDEDFVVQDEEEEEEDEEDSDDALTDSDELIEADEEELERLRNDLKMENEEDVTVINPPKNGAGWSIVYSLVVFIIAATALYLYSSSHLPSHSSKTIALYTLIILGATPILIAVSRVVRFYQCRKKDQEQKIATMVSDALKLLQSPDNPKGLMPVLHIRDTLITPVERSSKKTMDVWKKSVKFIEDHESRVKVEMVNIDGEDFRAWKWIGARKP